MKKLDSKILKRNVIFYIVTFMFIVMLLVAGTTHFIEKIKYEQDIKHYTQLIYNNINHTIKHHVKDYTHYIEDIIQHIDLPLHIKKRDNEKLYLSLKPKWDLFRKNNPYFAMMSIHLNDGTTLLHMPKQKFIDNPLTPISPMVQRIHHSHKEISGYESNKYGQYYRILTPIFDTNQSYLGALELGIELNLIIHTLHELNNFEGLILLKDENKTVETLSKSSPIEGYHLQSAPTSAPKLFYDALISSEHIKKNKKMTIAGKLYQTYIFTLNDFEGIPKVKLVLFHNVSNETVPGTILFYLLLLVLLLSFIFVLWFVSKRINSYEVDAETIYTLQMKEIYRLNQVLKNSPVSVVITDEKGNIEYVNPWFTNLTGYTLEEAKGKNPRILKSDYHTLEEYMELWEEISHGNIWSGTFKNITKTGREYWESAIIAPVKDDDGKIVNYIGIKQEISEKIYLKEALVKQKEQNQQLGHILEESHNEIFVFDKTSLKFIYANKGACKNLGYTVDELLELTPLDITAPTVTLDMFHEMIQGFNSDEEALFLAARHKRKDGTTYPIDVYLQETMFNGEMSYVAFITDTTEREKMQKILHEKEDIMIAQSQHAAMGEMISMIAHQWRQPLTTISMGANNLLADVELESISKEAISEQSKRILTQTEYLSQTIDDFRNFFRPKKEIEEVKLDELIKEVDEIMGKSFENNNISLNIKHEGKTIVKTYSRELLQVYINILKNAKEALVQNRTEDRHIEVMIHNDKENVITTVTDNGGGIDEEIIANIFDPYFSTKEEINGTGLGLYMSKTIIEKHLHGTIEAYNTKNGACFKVVLPKIWSDI